jgi:hypothetical protein
MTYATPNAAYWQAQANACKRYADEGACLARISRRAPGGVTVVPGFGGLGRVRRGRGIFAGMSGLGQSTAQDIASGASLIAGLISNPEATLRVQGPRIVTALDSYIVGPVVQAAVERSTPYILRYLTPPLITLYVMTAMSTWFSFEVLTASRKKMTANRKRRRH